MVTILEPEFAFSDERGNLTQLVSSGYKQFNVITSKKGAVRGRHYHKLNNEAFYVISGKLHLEVAFDDYVENHTFCSGSFFRIDANVTHSFMFAEDTLLVSMYDKGVETGTTQKDIYTREAIS